MWIADKFCIFARLKQLSDKSLQSRIGCELLTNFVSLHVWNNQQGNRWERSELWIADKFCIFARLKQYSDASVLRRFCCELLTNFVSLHVWNNKRKNHRITKGVVNCWQILYLCTSETIQIAMNIQGRRLWIADKFCIFARLKQCFKITV